MNKTVKTFEGELELGHLDMLVAASARDMWVEELQELAETDERIVFVTADGGYAGKENEFRLKHPDRMLPVGIAEMDQVGIASGLALCGKIPYIRDAETADFKRNRKSGSVRIVEIKARFV